jgi:hypothetical protein
MTNRPSKHNTGPYAQNYGLPEWPDLNFLHRQLMRAPRVDEVRLELYSRNPYPPGLRMEIYRKGVMIGWIKIFKDEPGSRVVVFGPLAFEENEQKQGTFSALCVGMLAWFDRGYFKKLTSRGRLSEKLEPRLHAIGFEPLYDPVADEVVLASDLTNKNSLLHQKLNEWERTHKIG